MQYLDGVQDAVYEADEANDTLPSDTIDVLPSDIQFRGIQDDAEGNKTIDSAGSSPKESRIKDSAGSSLKESRILEEEEPHDIDKEIAKVEVKEETSEDEDDVVNDLVNLNETGDSLASVESQSSVTIAKHDGKGFSGMNISVSSQERASLALFYDESTLTTTSTITPTSATVLLPPPSTGISRPLEALSTSASTRASTPLLSTPPPPGLSSPLVDLLPFSEAIPRESSHDKFDAISRLGFDEVVFETER